MRRRARDRARRVAVLRGAARHPQRGRDGRRAHLRAPDHPARRGEHRRDDGGLGQAALRRAGADQQPHRGRGSGNQPRGLRHHVQAAKYGGVGVTEFGTLLPKRPV